MDHQVGAECQLNEVVAEQQLGLDAEQGQLRAGQFQCAPVGVADTDDAVATVAQE
jgi:hypothetical protein